ncbi:MAG: fatty acid desaturase [Xanthomonadales bacterium]|nr:fatty acid desaturase [Xanthomonadales bacterium]
MIDEPAPRLAAMIERLSAWLDSQSLNTGSDDAGDDRVDWPRVLPFIGIHLACFAVLWVGFSWAAVILAVASYGLRMFAVTAFYHRYFSHRAFKAGRVAQFVFAVLGATATQRGPLWWAAHHREHHLHADLPEDPHSPRDGFWRSHVGWFLGRANFATRIERVPDLAKYPELRWLDRFDVAVPVLYAASLWGLGALAERFAPGLGLTAGQALVWGYFVSTVVLYHATFTINSLAHRFGWRDFDTRDDSRNNPWLAVLTMGEGWHNNHHFFPGSVRQGFRWWQWDPSYYAILGLEKLGVVHGLKQPPASLRRVSAPGAAR